MQVNWYIDFGTGFKQVPPPRNWRELEIELLFVNDRPDMPYSEFPSATVQSVAFEWVGTNSTDINNYITGGLYGTTPGIYEALPIRIDFCSSNGQTTSLTQYGIDLANESALFECDKVIAPLKKCGEVDFINSIADTISFAWLADAKYTGAGSISFSDFTRTPYCINNPINFTQIAVLSISTYLLIKELKEGVMVLANDITELAAFIASCTASWGNVLIVAWKIIVIAIHIAYYLAICIALVNMIKEILDNLYPPTKYKLGMKVETLMLKACQSVGLKFSSSLLVGSNLTIIPRKFALTDTFNPLYAFSRGADEFKNNGKHYGYYDGTFKQLIVDMQDLLNASAKVVNGTLYFEDVNFWNKQNAFMLPNTVVPGFHANAPAPNGTNASRLAMNYFIEYQLDPQDTNTYDNYAGTTVQVSLNPKNVKNRINQLNKGLTRIQLNFAQASRKDHTNKLEYALNITIGTLQSVLSALGGSGAPLLIGNSRVGFMELSSDYIGIQKIFIGSGTQNNWMVASTSRATLSATSLLNNHHYVNLATRGNQYLLYSNKKIPLCCKDFVILTTNNILTTADKKKGKFSKILWNPDKETAAVDYGIKQNYTNNLVETITSDGK